MEAERKHKSECLGDCIINMLAEQYEELYRLQATDGSISHEKFAENEIRLTTIKGMYFEAIDLKRSENARPSKRIVRGTTR